MAQRLGRLIPNPCVTSSKPPSGTKVDSDVHSPGGLVVKSKLSTRGGSAALRQLIPIHKKGS